MSTQNSFDQEARRQAQSSMVGELWRFLRCNKKWWLGPIVLLLLLMALLIALSGGAAAPFIYTLF
jgi:hypothetical protein